VKITHRRPGTNWFAVPESDPVDEHYAAQVQQATERAERQYKQAQQRLAHAEKRLARALAEKARAGHKKRIAQLRALVDERRAELADIERMMTTPAVTADKHIMLRTGLDNHLELGQYKPPKPRHMPPGAVERRMRGQHLRAP
jgi:hypothetical protein